MILRETIKNTPWKLKLTAILSFSFTASFMILCFTPLELFFNNPTNFLVSWKFLLPSLFAAALIGTAALSIALLLLWRGKTMVGVVLLLLSGTAVAYMQFMHHRFMVIPVYLFPVSAVLWFFSKKGLRIKPLILSCL